MFSISSIYRQTLGSTVAIFDFRGPSVTLAAGPDPCHPRMATFMEGLTESMRASVPTTGPHDELMVLLGRTAKVCPPLLGETRTEQDQGVHKGFLGLLEERLNELAAVFRTGQWMPGLPSDPKRVPPATVAPATSVSS